MADEYLMQYNTSVDAPVHFFFIALHILIRIVCIRLMPFRYHQQLSSYDTILPTLVLDCQQSFGLWRRLPCNALYEKHTFR